MTPVRFGILGCSSIARRRMLPALNASHAARLEHIGSRDHATAAGFAREFGCSKWGSYEEVLSDPDVDAVYISTPPALHATWVRAAAEHGKHILCEKPAFTSRGVAFELVELCRRQNVRLMEGYMFSYHPQHAAVQSLLTAGRIGSPRFVHCEFTLPKPDLGNFRLRHELGGGVFLDAAGYTIAAALLLLGGSPAEVCCRVAMDAAAGVDTAASLVMNFAGGEVVHAFAAYDLHYRSRYSVLGTSGRIEVARAFSVPPEWRAEIAVEDKSGLETVSFDPTDQFGFMIEDFCAQITGTITAKGLSFEERLLGQQTVMEAAWRSHLQRRPVFLSEVLDE